MDFRPVLGITMGDPSGCGPEITVKALSEPSVYESCRPLVIGDARIIRLAAEVLGRDGVSVRAISSPDEARYEAGTIDVLDTPISDISSFRFGRVDAMCGEAAFSCVKRVIELALAGRVDATVTNALNKEALNLAGHRFSGHTEIYAFYTHTDKYTMMLAHGNMRVVHVSTHVSLREACDRVKKERVLDVIRIADRACRDIGIEQPRIGVAGLNPHSGEHGLFGTEETDEIIPAIEAAQKEGMTVSGPVPPDSVFPAARGGMYDIVVAMYHDQGHIPLKLEGFKYDENGGWQSVEGINITLGLPIIRASVDHGTAFDCAGKGTASEKSLLNAMDYAIRMAKKRV